MPSPSLLDLWFAAVRAGQTADFTSICTTDVEVIWNGDPNRIPWAGLYRGPDGVAAFFKAQRHHLEYQHMQLLDVTTFETGAVMTQVGRWRVRTTNVVVETRGVHVLRYRDGKVSAYEVYNDTGRFIEALHRAPA